MRSPAAARWLTSNTPGLTQELIFFGGATDRRGRHAGYATPRPRPKCRLGRGLFTDYLHGRATLARVYVLIDARHGLKTATTPFSKRERGASATNRADQNATRSARAPPPTDRSGQNGDAKRPGFSHLIAPSAHHRRRHPATAPRDRGCCRSAAAEACRGPSRGYIDCAEAGKIKPMSKNDAVSPKCRPHPRGSPALYAAL